MSKMPTFPVFDSVKYVLPSVPPTTPSGPELPVGIAHSIPPTW